MKKQSFRDRMHEHEGMSHHGKHKMHSHHEAMMSHDHGHISHHLKAEHARHSSPYENEVEKPHIPSAGKNEPMMNLHDFKGDAMDTAYGQAGEAGCASDEKKIHSQFKSYGWDANTGY